MGNCLQSEKSSSNKQNFDSVAVDSKHTNGTAGGHTKSAVHSPSGAAISADSFLTPIPSPNKMPEPVHNEVSTTGRPTAVGQAHEPQPDEATLNKRFEDFMEEKCFKTEVRDNMRKMPAAAKWTILKQESTATGEKKEENNVQYWINLLKEPKFMPNKNQMASLRVVLRGVGKSWLKEFAEQNGVNFLLNYLNRTGLAEGVILEILRCLKAFINNDYGLSVLINSPTGIEQLALSLVSADDLQRIEIVDLLAVVVWVSDSGHELVVEALNSSRFKHPYQVLVQALSSDNPAVQTRKFYTQNMNFLPSIILRGC
jgi:hypothetical protein